jgi:hypothetical protein
MKYLSAIAMCLLLSVTLAIGDEDETTVNDIKVDGDDVQLVIQALYENWSGYNLIEASDVEHVHVPIWFHSEPGREYSPAEAAKLIQKVLLDQAGIIITPLDDKNASVTYNDRLPKKKPTPKP